jgi:magnesium transporter
VLDEDDKMVGVVDINLFTDEVLSMTEQRSAENVFQMIGVHVELGREVSPWMSFKDRFPWLLCNIAGGILCAFLAGVFSSLLDSIVVLAMFIPVVLALAESVSIQSLTLTLRGLQDGRSLGNLAWTALRKEFVTAAMLGLAAGGLVALVARLWQDQTPVALVIWISICLSVIFACLLGVAIPTAARLMRFDPRIAAGPITLACADLGTLLLYFSAGTWILGAG